MYIMPEVLKKYDTTAMATVINEACIDWLHENCYLVRGDFLVENEQFFCFWVGFSEGQPIPSGDNKQDWKRGTFLLRWGYSGHNLGSIIKSAGY